MVFSSSIDVVTYALRLEDDCYYVGRSKSLKERLSQHWKHEGAIWTKIHKPVELLKLWPGDKEHQVTLAGFAKYGIKKVRGYIWCQENLNADTVTNINNHLRKYK